MSKGPIVECVVPSFYGLTVTDVEATCSSLIERIFNALDEGDANLHFLARLDMDERYVVIRAWRQICERFSPIYFHWNTDVAKHQGRAELYIDASEALDRTIKLDTVEDYRQVSVWEQQQADDITFALAQRIYHADRTWLCSCLAGDIEELLRCVHESTMCGYVYNPHHRAALCIHIAHISETFIEPLGYPPLEWHRYRGCWLEPLSAL
jgi:hypothetical protein